MIINIKIIDIETEWEYNAVNVIESEGFVMIDWIIGILIAAALAAVVIKKIKDKKAGKSGCGCGCSGCSMNGKCHN